MTGAATAIAYPTTASPIHGQCRARWCFEGEAFTSYGAWVPKEVMRADEEMMSEGLGMAPDEEVLADMTPVLPESALPVGSQLGQPPPKVDREKIEAMKARMRERTAADAVAPASAEAAAPIAAVESSIEMAALRRENAEKDEKLSALSQQVEFLMAERKKAAEKAAAEAGETAPPPADPLDVTGTAGAKAPKK